MRKLSLYFVCVIFIAFFLSACGNSEEEPDEPYGIMDPTNTFLKIVEEQGLSAAKASTTDVSALNYSIIVDDSLGMLGFTSRYCTSYSTTLSAVLNASINGTHSFYAASSLVRSGADAVYTGDKFFEYANESSFFQPTSNNIAEVITSIADLYDGNTNQLCILISDLMIPTEDICLKTANSLSNTFLLPPNTTVGIIGIVGDFSGTIDNLPIDSATGRPTRAGSYMVAEKDINGVFRHPLYVLFLGNDRAVLEAMNYAYSGLQSSGMFDDSNPIYALYFSEYDAIPKASNDMKISFDTGEPLYDEAMYPIKYIIRGVPDQQGSEELDYGTTSGNIEIDMEQAQLLSRIRIIKMYTGVRGNTSENVKTECSIPFTFVDSSNKNDEISDKYDLLKSVSEIEFSEKDFQLTPTIIAYRKGADGKITEDINQTILQCESANIDFDSKKVNLVLSMDTNMLEVDDPILFEIEVIVSVKPQWEEVSALFGAEWVSDMTLNQKQFTNERMLQPGAITSARYTSATTAKTPFLSSLLNSSLREQQIQITIDAIKKNTEACISKIMFGIVVRDIPAKYVHSKKWDQDENFDWAFSYNEAYKLIHPENTPQSTNE